MTVFKIIGKILAIGLIFSLLLLAINFLGDPSAANTAPLADNEISSAISRDYPALIASLKAAPEAYGYQAADLEGISFLNPVRFISPEYSIEELRLGKKVNTLHIPLINENQDIIAIFSIIKSATGINSTIGKDFAPMLNRAKQDGILKAALFQNKNGLFVASLDDQYILDMKLGKVSGFFELQTLKNQSKTGPYVIIDLSEISHALTDLAQE